MGLILHHECTGGMQGYYHYPQPGTGSELARGDETDSPFPRRNA